MNKEKWLTEEKYGTNGRRKKGRKGKRGREREESKRERDRGRENRYLKLSNSIALVSEHRGPRTLSLLQVQLPNPLELRVHSEPQNGGLHAAQQSEPPERSTPTYMCDVSYSEKIWRALNLANGSPERFGEF